MQITRCYYCGSEKRSFYAEENGFNLVKCSNCGLLYVDDRPDDTEVAQSHVHGKHQGNKEFDITGAYNPYVIPRYLRILDDLYQGNIDGAETWLDVGCGHGEFMMAVGQYTSGQVKVCGIDPNVHKQASARERGLDVGYFDIQSHDKKYDVISLLNVYSHLPDPESFMVSLTKIMDRNKELVLETGDTTRLSPRDFPRPMDLPDHLSFASEDIVKGILERIGFEIISIKKYPFMDFDLNRIVREFIKVVVPGYKSNIRYFLKRRVYAQTDMYIRARYKG